MLIICSVSSSFWTCFSSWWHDFWFNQKLTLSESTSLYGWHKESYNWEVLNYCLIVAKYNVFATSVRNSVLDFDSFLLRLNNKIDILRTMAFRSNRLSQFNKKNMGQTSLDMWMLVSFPWYLLLQATLFCCTVSLIRFASFSL